ncbi:hypothetical protein [Lacrimispora sphenoides]|uniref:Uncharacterized protein n=1 Tax=Lacrimispora sphenoides JCM 1415 TaxID=1297793 RepID=A0ABY1CH87_9FIRM|nr:hypothetical protein [Lacrimispora sphenoides]SEU04143.1 hypothetical protein SAMN02745906_4270 [[Clostridium] sphenoides JCM 1415]SUY48847.1 Uncharacterised protein [Lacrimispora sphenoides]
MKSLNAEIKGIIKETLEVGACNRKEIINVVKQRLHDRKSLTHGKITGVIKTMKESGEIETVCRGIYQKGSSNNSTRIRNRIKSIMIQLLFDLKKACTVNLLQLDEFDKDLIMKIQAIIDELEAKINAVFSEEE